ncbi:MAG: hypothetical protein A2Z20_12185 [Bdellovibrionales bacterium RBG_16_40_8]|nr:MAG: hypothetical protein A2Z20_12185 [Bdellovibrionales bacterium RBG_16_40_8]
MRYLSLVFIIFLMWWSWSLINTPSLLSEDTHVGIQDDLRRIISEYIIDNLPGAADVRFDRFWTQTLKKDKIKATFSYSFEEPPADDENGGTRIGVEGHAILNRTKEQNSEYDVWNLDELYVLNNHITFKEGVTIRAADK